MTMELTAHDVTAIELVSTFKSNGNSRCIRITTASGSFEITLYGETDVLDLLPRSEEFTDLQTFAGAAEKSLAA